MDNAVERVAHPGVDDRIVVLRVRDIVDAVFIRTDRLNVLVDTLHTPEACRRALELVGEDLRRRPLIVVNSHLDWDHFWGNAAVCDFAPIIAHERAMDRFRGRAIEKVLSEKMRDDTGFSQVRLEAPTLTFSDKLILNGGDLTLELFHTPGHTPDHVAVWIPQLRTCLAVDAVENPIPEVWSEQPGDLSALTGSLQRIRDLEAEHVILAHGGLCSPSIVTQNLNYFDTLSARVRRADAKALGQWTTPLPEGLRLADLVTLPGDLSIDMRRFYENCHRTNLRATVQAALAG